MRRYYSTGRPTEARIGFSRAVRVGNIIEVSGTAPLNPDGSTAAPGDAYGQTRACFDIIAQALEYLGGTLRDVVRTRIYLADVSRWEEIGRAHAEVFGEIRPASTMLAVAALLDPAWLVEIEATAVIGDRA